MNYPELTPKDLRDIAEHIYDRCVCKAAYPDCLVYEEYDLRDGINVTYECRVYEEEINYEPATYYTPAWSDSYISSIDLLYCGVYYGDLDYDYCVDERDIWSIIDDFVQAEIRRNKIIL